MTKKSLYMSDEEWTLIEEGRTEFRNRTGVNISLNKYLRSLLFALHNKNDELEEALPTNPLQISYKSPISDDFEVACLDHS